MMSPPYAPQCVCRSPPALDDDALSEIFLRVPPEDPKSLVRASAVCTSWRGVLSDDPFARLYRSSHGAPPTLGFLYNTRHEMTSGERGSADSDEEYFVSHFISTASFRPPACHQRRCWRAVDSRHGFVLFHTPKRAEDFVVCDLVTYDRWRIKANHAYSRIIWHDEDGVVTWNAAVLCAKDRCDHLYCHGGPFLVALVGCDAELGITFASVYSSETRKWSDMISIEEPDAIDMRGHTAVVGDKVYFQCKYTESIVEYNIGKQEQSVIEPPFDEEDQKLPYVVLLMGVKDGMLLLATVLKPRLYLWSMEATPNGAGEWVRRRVIELEPVLPPCALFGVYVVGYVEGVGIIFLSTEAGLYTIELSSGRSKKVHGDSFFEKVMPYMSFYSKAWGRLPTSE